MNKRRKNTGIILVVLLLLSLMQPIPNAAAQEMPETSFGQVLDMRTGELAPDADYYWYNMKLDRGLQKVHFVEFNPANPNLELQAGRSNGKVYGFQGVTKMADDADRAGNRVIAGINADFYDLSNGVPYGLFVDDGIILNSPVNGRSAFGMLEDGTTVYGPSPELIKTVSIGGAAETITHINRPRGAEELVLYTADFFASTKTSDQGDEAILNVLEGQVKSGQTLKLQVSAIRNGKGDAPLAEGTVVLSASGKYKQLLAGLRVGDIATVTIALPEPWDQAKTVVGGSGLLIKDGVVHNGIGPEGVHPRTAIGTKADGSVVLFEIDGRSPGFSEGVETLELANILKDLGVVNAMNLDGGGSSTFVARLPGETFRNMMNRGSDGGERQTANGLLLVNKGPEGAADKLVVQPNFERVLEGSSFSFGAAAVDASGHPATFEGVRLWSADTAIGTVDQAGTFTAGAAAGTGTIEVRAGTLTGKGEVEVVDRLTELKFPDAEKTFESGAEAVLQVSALRDGQVIQADNSRLEWRVEGEIGTIDGDGRFLATNENEKSGKIYVKYKDVETSMDVKVGLPPVVLEDFESGLDRYIASGARYNKVEATLETDEDIVRFGGHSLKLEYDFIGTQGTSGAYLQTLTGTYVDIPGYPEKIGMWVYGDGKRHWLRGQMRDGKGNAVPIDFTDQTVGVDWIGWKYVEAEVPPGKPLPLKFDQMIRYMETDNGKKDAGVIYVDQIRALYGATDDDTNPPLIRDISPADKSTLTTNMPTIRAYAEDDGYDPSLHPGTTLIDPDKIRLYVDGVRVDHALYPPEGRISYTPNEPLADGVHRVKLAVRDLAGNQTIREWIFNVDTGSPKFVYDSPAEVYAGNTYELNVGAEKAAELRGGHVEFGFDPSKVEGLNVVRGAKLTEEQLQPAVDEESGTVRLNLQQLNSAQLTDNDLLGQIRFTVKHDASGTNVIDYKSGLIVLNGGPDEGKEYIGMPVEAAVKHHLSLQWDETGAAQGFTTRFRVTDESGSPVAGAKLLADGAEVGDGSGVLLTDQEGALATDALTRDVKQYRLQATKDLRFSPVVTFKVSPLAGSELPRNVTVNMGADPAASRAFTWQTNPLAERTVVEFAKEAEFTDFRQPNVMRTDGESYLYLTEDTGLMRVHKAVLADLEPGTRYVYRVGDGDGNVSGQGSFATAEASGDGTKFLFFGDSQAGDQKGFELWGNILHKAIADHPDAEFIMHAGDMVDKGYLEKEWNMWFDEAQDAFMNTTLVGIIGNHEVMGTRANSDFLAHFNQPGNGLAGLEGTNFSFDYKDVHFVVLNSEYEYERQAEWLRDDLAKTEKPWKIVAFHRGPYGSQYDTEVVRSNWVPVLEEFGVDLVLNGHDHIYLRTTMKDGEKKMLGEGTTYVVAGSTGPKFYGLTQRPWHQIVDDEHTQIYTSIETKGNTLTFEARTIDGREVDRFTLTKEMGEPDPIAGISLLGRTMLKPGGTDQVAVEALHASGKRSPIAEGVMFASSNPQVADIDGNGKVRAFEVGETVISATYSGFTDSYMLRVSLDEPSLVDISLTGPAMLQVGETSQTVTKAVYSDGSQEVLTEGVAFASSNEQVATVDAAGTITAHQEGTTVITATYAAITTGYELTVIPRIAPEPQLVALEIRGLESKMTVGLAKRAEALGRYSDESVKPLKDGVAFASSLPQVASVNEDGLVKALRQGSTVITATYEQWSASFSLTVEGATTSTPPSGGESGASGGTKPDRAPKPETRTGRMELTAEQIKKLAGPDGVVIETDQALHELVLPGNAATLTSNARFTIVSKWMELAIPGEVIRALEQLVSEEERAAAKMILKSVPLSAPEAEKLLAGAERRSGARLQAATPLFKFSFAIIIKDGHERALSEFAKPVSLKLRTQSEVNRKLAGMYGIASNGALQYAGGTWAGGAWTASIDRVGIYSVLEYNKTFSDMASEHWAADAIRELSAKHIVNGESGDRFLPNRHVTRAEFAALLVRLLGLQGEGNAVFSDVPADRWYANEVALAAKAGLIVGVGGTSFAPDAEIKRQEMAAMIVRAYEYALGKKADATAPLPFADTRSAPEWARNAVRTAYALGLVHGRSSVEFQPEGYATRAESAKMMHNLLYLMEK
ncbi:hypothetical protein PAE9249_01749 [Paenibacillus sp. CECT 9249]|uniref:phosphodiester glycosidase family protein n=1 Tax=Paenibacillus sp. CECT 9249 TaxID=2845385 RepID=UPI001E42E990|nr:phosphodiester glycosidase family protein [Paenibacillus sp. CECT 9249]CAH0119250.1 hypothetical protein PAE9249_01749 [Paenibacillus sp. CECT 9249]